MADGDPIKRSDFATDDGLKAPLDFAKNTDAAVKANKELITTIEKLQKDIDKNKTSVSQLSKTTQDLLGKNKQLEESLKNVNKGLKEKRDRAKDLGGAMSELDGVLGGSISRVQGLTQKLTALMRSPIVLFLATLAAAFKALQSSVQAYYDTALEGEEVARRQTAAWDAFGIASKRAWASFGKTIQDTFLGPNGVQSIISGFLNYFSPGFAAFYDSLAKQATDLADLQSKLILEHAKDVVDDANTEVRVNKLLDDARNKLGIAAEDRLAAVRGAREEIKKQIEGDKILADLEVKSQEKRIELLGGVVVANKLISDYSEAEIRNLKVNSEEIKKLADLQAKRLKVESDGSAKITGLYKLEKSTFDEIEHDKLAVIQEHYLQARKAGEGYIDTISRQAQDTLSLLDREFADGKKSFTFFDPNELNKETGSLGAFVTLSIKNLKDYGKTREDVIQRSNDQIHVAQLDFFDKQINAEIDAEIASIKELKIGEDEKFKLIQAAEDRRTKLLEQSADVRSKVAKKESDDIVEEQKKIDAALEGLKRQSVQTAIDITRARFEAEDVQQQERMGKLEKQMSDEVKLAGDNKEAVRAIENKYNKQIADSERQAADNKRRAAIFDKSLAVTKIGIQTTLKAFEALPNVILAGIITGTGILAAASVVARPIPAYEKGVQGAPGGPAVVGEGGPELMRLPSGEEFLTPGRPTLVDVAPGTDILTHQETLNLLARRSLAAATTTDRPMVGDDKMDRLIKVVRDKPVTKTGLTKAEFEEVLWRTKAFDNLYR